MPLHKRTVSLFTSTEGDEIKQELMKMLGDIKYSTTSSYSSKSELYPDNLIPFVEKHMHYLNTHPSVDPSHYLANLRLITKVR